MMASSTEQVMQNLGVDHKWLIEECSALIIFWRDERRVSVEQAALIAAISHFNMSDVIRDIYTRAGENDEKETC